MRKYYRRSIEISIMICLIASFWLVNCWISEIAPWGVHLIDKGDMGEQSEPMYFFIWDVLHGKKNLYFDWTTSLSGNMIGAVWHFGILSPFNLFFYFIPREWIVISMPYFIMIKLISIGCAINCVLNKWFDRLSTTLRLAFSLLYVFSFYNIEYYRAPMWLDLAFIFPIVMFGLFKLLLEGKSCCYFISLCMAVVMSFQHTYMLALCLLFVTGIATVLYKKIRERLLLLFVRTLEVVLLTGIVWIPGTIQIFSSKRVGRNWGLYDIWNAVWINYPQRWVKLLGLGIPIAFFFFYIVWEKRSEWYKDKKILFLIFILGIFTAPFVFESIHIFWHGGSYQGYPIRFGYMVVFWAIVAGVYAINNRQSILGKKRIMIEVIAGIVAVIDIMCVFVIRYRMGRDITFLMILICLCLEVIVGVCLYLVSDRVSGWLLLVYVGVHAIAAISYSWIYSADKMDNFLIRSEDVFNQQEVLFEEHTPLDRIRSQSIVSNNYALAMNQSSMSSYLAVAEKEEQDFLGNLGYAVVGDRLSDYGGTIFSDMLLGIDYIFSVEDENADLYSFIAEIDNWKFYKCLYQYSLGILLDHTEDIEWKEAEPFKNQNEIMKQWFGRELLQISESNGSQIEVKTEPNSILYIYTNQMDHVLKIEITDVNSGMTKVKELPTSGWNNGIQELGSWHGENVIITVSGNEEIKNLQAAVLRMDDLNQLPPKYGEITYTSYTQTGMKMKLLSDHDAYLYLPIYGSNGWQCRVNDEKVSMKFMDKMLLIPVKKGKSIIELNYVSPGLPIGLCLSIIGMLTILVEKMLLRKRLLIPQRQFIVLNVGIVLSWIIVFSVIYIGSIIGAMGFIIRNVF